MPSSPSHEHLLPLPTEQPFSVSEVPETLNLKQDTKKVPEDFKLVIHEADLDLKMEDDND